MYDATAPTSESDSLRDSSAPPTSGALPLIVRSLKDGRWDPPPSFNFDEDEITLPPNFLLDEAGQAIPYALRFSKFAAPGASKKVYACSSLPNLLLSVPRPSASQQQLRWSHLQLHRAGELHAVVVDVDKGKDAVKMVASVHTKKPGEQLSQYLFPKDPRDPSGEGIIKRGLTVDQQFKIICALIKAVYEFHTKSHLKHLDLKPENLIYDESTNTMHLIDLDDSEIVNIQEEMGSGQEETGPGKGTYLFAAPEIYEVPPLSSQKSDVFSMGRVIQEILGFGDPPAVQRLWGNEIHYEEFEKLVRGLTLPPSWQEPQKTLLEHSLRGMLALDPDERPSLAEIYQRVLGAPPPSYEPTPLMAISAERGATTFLNQVKQQLDPAFQPAPDPDAALISRLEAWPQAHPTALTDPEFSRILQEANRQEGLHPERKEGLEKEFDLYATLTTADAIVNQDNAEKRTLLLQQFDELRSRTLLHTGFSTFQGKSVQHHLDLLQTHLQGGPKQAQAAQDAIADLRIAARVLCARPKYQSSALGVKTYCHQKWSDLKRWWRDASTTEKVVRSTLFALGVTATVLTGGAAVGLAILPLMPVKSIAKKAVAACKALKTRWNNASSLGRAGMVAGGVLLGAAAAGVVFADLHFGGVLSHVANVASNALLHSSPAGAATATAMGDSFAAPVATALHSTAGISVSLLATGAAVEIGVVGTLVALGNKALSKLKQCFKRESPPPILSPNPLPAALASASSEEKQHGGRRKRVSHLSKSPAVVVQDAAVVETPNPLDSALYRIASVSQLTGIPPLGESLPVQPISAGQESKAAASL